MVLDRDIPFPLCHVVVILSLLICWLELSHHVVAKTSFESYPCRRQNQKEQRAHCRTLSSFSTQKVVVLHAQRSCHSELKPSLHPSDLYSPSQIWNLERRQASVYPICFCTRPANRIHAPQLEAQGTNEQLPPIRSK